MQLTWLQGWKRWAFIVLGFVAGLLPDAALLVSVDLYSSFHGGLAGTVLSIIPAGALHLLVDAPFHAVGGVWWDELWWLAILIDLVFGFLGWVLIARWWINRKSGGITYG